MSGRGTERWCSPMVLAAIRTCGVFVAPELRNDFKVVLLDARRRGWVRFVGL